MLSRPAFSIRKFIPQKKHDGDEFEGSYFYHDDDDEMDTLSKIKTWRPPMGLIKRSKPSIDIRRSEDLHRIICIPPLPDTPQSSTSSLCSYDNGTGYVVNTISPRASPPRRPDRSPLASPLASPQRSPQRSPERSPLILPQPQFQDHQHSRSRSPVSAHSLRDQNQLTPPSSPPQQAEMALKPPADLPGAVSSAPAAASERASTETTTETPTVKTPAGAENVAFSENVQKLIQETDEAFKLRQSFIEAKLPASTLDKFPKPKSLSPLSPPARRKSQRRSQGSVKSTKSVKSVKSAKSPTKASMKTPLSPAQARLPSNTRPKRAKSKKSRRRPRAPPRQSSLFQLTESAKDLFNSRLFHRIEADEMLPESTLREIRMSRAARWTKSPELGVTHVDNNNNNKGTATTPIEPLSLDESVETEEDVVTPRASVANHGGDVNRDGCKTPTTEPQEQGNGSGQEQVPMQSQAEIDPPMSLHQPDSPTTKSYHEDDGEEGTLPIMMIVEDEPSTQGKLAESPMPPIKTHLHRRLPSRQLPPLPTIPEIVATGPQEAALSPTSIPQPPGTPCKINTDDYVFLDSTPFTLTVPAFRHGQIRLAKADLPIGKLAAAVDDTLDWTAFQMAILGGAGDFFSEPTDYSRPSDAELDELDEMVSWFGSFGFQGAGNLVGPPEQPPRTPGQLWTPVLPRTPALSPPSAVSTPASNSHTPITGNRSPGFRRIDPPAPSPSPSEYPDYQSRPDRGTRRPEQLLVVSDSIAGRFFPQQSNPPPPFNPKHRRSVSSGTFGFQQQQQQQPPPPPYSPSTPSSLESRRHVGLAIDSTRRPSVDSLQSLPQSPMMDLVVSHDVEGNEYMVPMGFNLSHDLGDFLNWHAEHVSGSGFGLGSGSPATPSGVSGLDSARI
ncbi:hypothetical protein MMYC01_201786 [Madurella mycetomatis]|uniref:Uncharacterized protein n=1 Tax=Madurella mycetomatis TaxID=100816 RepID=A0A175WH73_9PEZI|nr:hypothetical protein MMYC01_201786 [Madurella mycetomatis]